MIITLTPDIEQALAAEAQKLGRTPEQLALDSLRERFLSPERERSPAEAQATLADFLRGHLGVLHSSEHVPGGARLAGPLLTTWVRFTEAMYLLGTVGGYRYQAALWSLWATGRVVLHDLTPAEADRMAALMAQYQDTPMDLADASLVVVSESRGLHRVFTTDSDFYVYRLADGSALEVVP
jgi:predicted nucleic acid-binding protein